ncbi:REJ domain-containing protein [uncultured Draconibacterium sp.]|uniref:PKD domain-containing protein n=1 Tax=uncultured Draconibacterium sp. TaxID=1573823 RepID=UPI0025CE59A5|nr:REJ domain-containing protein [uncultured Draconibacterium sp.]
MKHLSLLLVVIAFLSNLPGSAQTRFNPVGDFTSAMNINLLAVKINQNNLEAGDEIGIYDGDLCVGAIVLEKNLEETFDAITQAAVAGANDVDTQQKDGFTSGNVMSFVVWDKSEEELVDIDSVKFYNPADGSEIMAQNFEVGATVYVSLRGIHNYTPNSDAGPDYELFEGEQGQLNGSDSNDLNQDSILFNWIDVDTLGLHSSTAASPTFTAPEVNQTTLFRVILVVNDGMNFSKPDTVIITVFNVISGPVANAGTSPVVVPERDTLVLDGGNSYDPDGSALKWQWSTTEGTIDIIESNSAVAKLVAPQVNADSTLFVVLKVTNSSELSAYDSVQVTIENVNVRPFALAQSKTVASEGEQVRLDGSNSYDPDKGPGELSYQWLSLNGGEIGNQNSRYATFYAPWLLADSLFLFSLTVYDGEDYSLSDTIEINVVHANLPPVASAGADLIVTEGAEVVLNGNSSFDPEGDTLWFQWESDYLLFDDVFAVSPTFVANEIHSDTVLFVTLKVSDGELWSDPDTLQLTIKNINKPPEWITLPKDSAYLGISYSGLIEAADPDRYDTLSISVSGLPEWLTFEAIDDHTTVISTDSVPHSESLLGDYEIELQVSDGEFTIDTVFVLNVSVLTYVQLLNLEGFSFYPNPAQNWITVKFEEPVGGRMVVYMFDATGKLVLDKRIIQQQTILDVSKYPKGLYLLIVNSSGQLIERHKLVIN